VSVAADTIHAMVLDQNEIGRLAGMGAALRPDWSARDLTVFIEHHFANRTYGDVAVAMAWVCARTRTETPDLLLESGAWWKATNTEAQSAARPPKRHEACADCGRGKDQHQVGPYADHLWQSVGVSARGRVPAERAAVDVRAQLAQARAQTCSHGVDRGRVRCAACANTERKATAMVAGNRR